MLRKKIVILVTIIYLGMGYSISNAQDEVKELSSAYSSLNECTTQKNVYNSQLTKYIRSDCFLDNGKYYYHLCNKVNTTCNTRVVTYTRDSFDSLIENPFAVGIDESIIPKVEQVSIIIARMSLSQLNKLNAQIDDALIKYHDKPQALQVLNYLKFDTENIISGLNSIDGPVLAARVNNTTTSNTSSIDNKLTAEQSARAAAYRAEKIKAHEGRHGWSPFTGLELDSSKGTRIRQGGYSLNAEGECSGRNYTANIYTGDCTCAAGFIPVKAQNSSQYYGDGENFECINEITGIAPGICGPANNISTLQTPVSNDMCESGVRSIYSLGDPTAAFSSRQVVSQIWGNHEGMYDSANISTGDQFKWGWKCEGIGPGAQDSPVCRAKYDVIAKEAECSDLHRSKSLVAPTSNFCKVGSIVGSVEYSRGVWRWFCVGEGFGAPALCNMIKEDRDTAPSGTAGKQCETGEGVTIKSGDSMQLYNPLGQAYNHGHEGRDDATCKAYKTTCTDGSLMSQDAETEYNTLWFGGSKWYSEKTSCLQKVPGRNKELTFQTNLRNVTSYSYRLNYSDTSNMFIKMTSTNSNLEPAEFTKELSFDFESLSVGTCTDYMLHGSGRIIHIDTLYETHMKFCKESRTKLGIYHRVKRQNSSGAYVFQDNYLRHGTIELEAGAQIQNVGDHVDGIPATKVISYSPVSTGNEQKLTFETNLNNITQYTYLLNYSDKNNIVLDLSRYSKYLEPSSFQKVLSFNFNALNNSSCTNYIKHGSGTIIGQGVLFETHLKFCKEPDGKLGIYHRVKRQNSDGIYIFNDKILKHGVIELSAAGNITEVGEFVEVPGSGVSGSNQTTTYTGPTCKLKDATVGNYGGPFYDPANSCKAHTNLFACGSTNVLTSGNFSPKASISSFSFYKSETKCLENN